MGKPEDKCLLSSILLMSISGGEVSCKRASGHPVLFGGGRNLSTVCAGVWVRVVEPRLRAARRMGTKVRRTKRQHRSRRSRASVATSSRSEAFRPAAPGSDRRDDNPGLWVVAPGGPLTIYQR
jgi:hypothetical protein